MDKAIFREQFQASDNKTYTLNDFKGQKILLYFYPKDSTPGCTTEACDFTGLQTMYQKAGYTIIGVSKDSIKSHQKFTEKYKLNFLLLSDPDLKLHEAFGAWGSKKLYGKTFLGVIRSTFLLDEELNIVKEYKNVKAKGHAERVLKEVSDENR